MSVYGGIWASCVSGATRGIEQILHRAAIRSHPAAHCRLLECSIDLHPLTRSCTQASATASIQAGSVTAKRPRVYMENWKHV